MKIFGHDEVQAQKVVIVGGGNIGYSLSKRMQEEDNWVSTSLIEFDKNRTFFYIFLHLNFPLNIFLHIF